MVSIRGLLDQRGRGPTTQFMASPGIAAVRVSRPERGTAFLPRVSRACTVSVTDFRSSAEPTDGHQIAT